LQSRSSSACHTLGQADSRHEAGVKRRLQTRLRVGHAIFVAASSPRISIHLTLGGVDEKPSGRQPLGARNQADRGCHVVAGHLLPGVNFINVL